MMMSSGNLLAQSNRQSCRRKIGLCSEGRLSRKRAGEEKRDRRLESLYGWSIQPSFSVLEGGISKGEEGWNVLSNAPPRRCELAHPTRPGRGVASLARAVRGNSDPGKRWSCETTQGQIYTEGSDNVLKGEVVPAKTFWSRGSASDRRIHGCCVHKKAVEGVGAVRICVRHLILHFVEMECEKETYLQISCLP